MHSALWLVSAFIRDDDRLIKTGFLREFPMHVAAAAGEEQSRQLFPAGRPVFAFKFADLKRVFVVDDVLRQPIVVFVPDPGLEGNALAALRFVDVGRRIGRPALQRLS